jgi:hypothetical protein
MARQRLGLRAALCRYFSRKADHAKAAEGCRSPKPCGFFRSGFRAKPQPSLKRTNEA